MSGKAQCGSKTLQRMEDGRIVCWICGHTVPPDVLAAAGPEFLKEIPEGVHGW